MPEPIASKQVIYESFDGFVKHTIREYYTRRGKTHPLDYAALLLASGQTISMGIDTLKEGSVGKKLAAGAVGAVALRMGLKYALSGPLGILATGATVASAGGYLYKNQEKIGKLMRRYKTLLAEARSSYEVAEEQFRAGRFTSQERNLMIDGLMHRFLDQIMTQPAEESSVAPEPETPGGTTR
jgi:hypothetical protein